MVEQTQVRPAERLLDNISGFSSTGILERTGAGTYAFRPRSGTGTTVASTSGTLTLNDCVKWDANGNAVASGAPCGSGSGSVTNVAATAPSGVLGITGSPITTTGTFAFAWTGTSGGIPYFSSSSALASSGALTANMPVIGGGAGVAPSVGTVSGNTTQFVTTTGTQTSGRCVKIDASGNHIADSGACGTLTANTGFAAIGWPAAVNPDTNVIMTASTAITVTDIRGTVDTAVGAAATVAVYKAPSGTSCVGGTIQHSGTFNANGTAITNQTLSLVGGAGNILAAGDRLCLVTTGGTNWTATGVGIGGVTVTYTVP
jgi:hypothetical protein